jgi:ethanolamine transporter EutH
MNVGEVTVRGKNVTLPLGVLAAGLIAWMSYVTLKMQTMSEDIAVVKSSIIYRAQIAETQPKQ